MLMRGQILRHGEDWVAAWSRRDFAAVPAGFDRDAIFRGPFAARMTGSDRLRGKAAIRTYSQSALSRIAHLRFTPIASICDETAQVMVIRYEVELEDSVYGACGMFRSSQPARRRTRPCTAIARRVNLRTPERRILRTQCLLTYACPPFRPFPNRQFRTDAACEPGVTRRRKRCPVLNRADQIDLGNDTRRRA